MVETQSSSANFGSPRNGQNFNDSRSCLSDPQRFVSLFPALELLSPDSVTDTQRSAEHPKAHVLVCGASNPSTDTLARRLRSLMPSQLLRLSHPTRPLNEVRSDLLPFCHVEGDRFGIPDVQTLLSKRVICTTVLDCSILLDARLTNSNLSTLERYLYERLHPEMSRTTLESPHFDYLLIDEAAQATESDLLPALAVVSTDPSICSSAHVTICGDSHQLSPHIVSPLARDHDLDVSLLERLLRLPLYADHPHARRNRRRNAEVKWEMETTPFVDLVRNYRSVEEIIWLPSTLVRNIYSLSIRPELELTCFSVLIGSSTMKPYYPLLLRRFNKLLYVPGPVFLTPRSHSSSNIPQEKISKWKKGLPSTILARSTWSSSLFRI